MVMANIGNEPISIQLEHNESITVPTGEVWKVRVSTAGHFERDITNTRRMNLGVNGVPVHSQNGSTQTDFETVFVGGDTIEVWQEDGQGTVCYHLGGFKMGQ